MLKFPRKCFGDAVLFLCPHGPSCVMGGVESTSCFCFIFSRGPRVHSVEGVSKRLSMLYVVCLASVNDPDKTVHDGESFCFPGMGLYLGVAAIFFSFFLRGTCL
jgi:hypothetical protein